MSDDTEELRKKVRSQTSGLFFTGVHHGADLHGRPNRFYGNETTRQDYEDRCLKYADDNIIDLIASREKTAVSRFASGILDDLNGGVMTVIEGRIPERDYWYVVDKIKKGVVDLVGKGGE